MKTKLITLLLVGMNSGLLVGLAKNNPKPDEKVQKLYNQPGAAAQPAAAPAEPVATEPAGEVLPLVQFEDAPLVDVIKTLARQAGLNVIFDPKVTALGADGKSPNPPVSIRLENVTRSEEHTSELQSPCNLVCRLLLEKKKKQRNKTHD